MNRTKYEQIKNGVKNSYNLVAKKYNSLFENELDTHEYDKTLLDEFSNNFKPNDAICEMGREGVSRTKIKFSVLNIMDMHTGIELLNQNTSIVKNQHAANLIYLCLKEILLLIFK